MDDKATALELMNSLLAAVGKGDQRAFRRLYDSLSPMLLGLLIKIVERHAIAEELLQECFVKIWQKATVFDPERGHPMAWITTLVRNHALDFLRARRPDHASLDWNEFMERWIDELADPYRDALTAQQLAAANDSIETLPPQMRTCVLMNYYQGHSQTDSAALLKAPMGTVKSWARRGLEKVKNDMVMLGYEADLA